MIWVPTHGWHLDLMRLRPETALVIGQDREATAAGLDELGAAGCCLTCVADDGTIAVIVGVRPKEKAAEAFLIRNTAFTGPALRWLRAVKNAVARVAAQIGTIEADAEASVPDRWFEWLGFRRIGETRWRFGGTC